MSWHNLGTKVLRLHRISPYAAIEENFTFDLKPEKLVYCSVKVNSRFFSTVTHEHEGHRTTSTTKQKVSEKPASNHNYNGGNLLQLRHLLGPE